MMVSKLGIAAVFAAGLGFAGSAEAVPIQTTFNFNTNGSPTADTGDVTTAAFITDPGPIVTVAIITDNTGLISGTTPITLTSPTPVRILDSFTKQFTTALGVFVEILRVTSIQSGSTSLGIAATGTIREVTVLSGAQLDPSVVFYSAAYTQNQGPNTQINVSYNDSTTPPPPPPPAAAQPDT